MWQAPSIENAASVFEDDDLRVDDATEPLQPAVSLTSDSRIVLNAMRSY